MPESAPNREVGGVPLAHPPRSRQGFCVFFTGLSGAGKSTISMVLSDKLLEIGTRPVTLLDGDIVRQHLSSELGFSRHDRDLNIKRVGFVASEITKNHGVAICASIAPYNEARREVRELISQYGGFIEVHVDTPLEVCEARDRKGLYKQARAGLIKNFTGIDDPYEVPTNPEMRLTTTDTSPEENAQQIVNYLAERGYLRTSCSNQEEAQNGEGRAQRVSKEEMTKGGMVIWIIGLSGSGKTSLGRSIYRFLKNRYPGTVFIDGDMVRDIMDNDLGHTIEDRWKNAQRISRLCLELERQGLSVVCATLGNFHQSQKWNREHFSCYREIYIRVSFETLLKRDPNGLYEKALRNETTNVVGVDIGYEPPYAPDLVVDNDRDNMDMDNLAIQALANLGIDVETGGELSQRASVTPEPLPGS